MTIDLQAEKPITLDEAARLVPASRGARATNRSTVFRWILRGVRGPDGRRVRLDGLRLGAKYITSREAVQRFAEALTPDLATDAPRPPRGPASRRRASERAGAKLAKLGI